MAFFTTVIVNKKTKQVIFFVILGIIVFLDLVTLQFFIWNDTAKAAY